MIGRRHLRALLAPVVVLTTGACFATRADVRVLQDDLRVVRAEMLASDSATQRKMDVELARVAALLAEVSDTVRAANAVTNRMSGDVRDDLRSIRQQLIAIQELTGQSQRRIQELRAEMETRATEAAPAVVPPGDSTARPGAAAPAAPAAPGPSQLYQIGQDQFRRGSNAAARGAFLELLNKHPTSDLAADALYMVAETWAADGQGASADSVYGQVVQRFPRSERAPTALYKRARALSAVGQTQQARVLYQQIVDRYPRSDAALLAQDFLRSRP